VHCLKNQKKLLQTYFDIQPQLEEKLLHKQQIKTQRLTLTHSQVMAMVYALKHVVPISKDQLQETQQLIQGFAEKREIYIQREHPIVEQFFEVYQYIEDKLFLHQHLKPLNHHTKDGFIAIRLNEYYERASEFKQPLADISKLKNYLRHSERFIANKNVYSAQLKKTISCWVFSQ
jgi:ABC-type sugar transport system ATPase subunit